MPLQHASQAVGCYYCAVSIYLQSVVKG